MGRRPSFWERKGRGWFCTINGKQRKLGDDFKTAEREFYRLKGSVRPGEIGRATVINLAHRFLEAMVSEIKPGTHRHYRFAMQSFVDMYGHDKAADLRPLHITAWLDLHPEWNQATRYTKAGIVKAWSSWCARWGWLEVDRLRGARYAQGEPRKGSPPKDLAKLLTASGKVSRELRETLEVLMDTGARPSEIFSLEKHQIDFKRRLANVRSKTGPRTFALTARSIEILRRRVKLNPRGALLRAPSGNIWLQPTFKRHVDKAIKLAGIPHLVPYQARHAFWERAIKAGADSVAVMKQLGHSSLQMLSRHYAHPSAETLVSVVDLAASKPKSSAGRAQRTKKRGKKRARR